MSNQIEQSLTRIEEGLLQQQKRGGRNNSDVEYYNKEFKKMKTFINNNKDSLTEDQKKNIQTQQSRIKAILDRLKPAVILLKQQEKSEYRQQIRGCLKTIEKKISSLNQKKDNKKDNKKRTANIQFFKYHLTKLTNLSELLSSSSKRFCQQHMSELMKYLNDIHVSQDDSVFNSDLKEVYQNIISFAEEPLQISYDLFNASFYNMPKINDYLAPKQTKEYSYRSSICPTYKMIDLSVIPKMSKQVLFFMFYIHKGEAEQFLAARELMRKSWRYYTRFHMWIKRSNPPNFDFNEQHQTGNYYTMGIELLTRDRRNIKVSHKHLITQLGN